MKLVPIFVGPLLASAMFTKLRRNGAVPSRLVPVFFCTYYFASVVYYAFIPALVGVEPELPLLIIAALTTILMVLMCFDFWFDEFIP